MGRNTGDTARRTCHSAQVNRSEHYRDLGTAASRGWTAYQSTLRLEFSRGHGVPTPQPDPWRTATRTDATDDALRELRRRAVDPVLASLLSPAELAGADVVVYREDGTEVVSLWVRVLGEDLQVWLWNPEFGAGQSQDPVDVAAHLADQMEDWVCETRFAWGQHRLATYRIPPAR